MSGSEADPRENEPSPRPSDTPAFTLALLIASVAALVTFWAVGRNYWCDDAFITFRYATSFLTPALFAIVLAVLPLDFVFVVGGGVAVAMGLLSTYLPRRL